MELEEQVARALYNHWMRDTAPALRPEWEDASGQLQALFLSQGEIAVKIMWDWTLGGGL